jgi:hypothetical protein
VIFALYKYYYFFGNAFFKPFGKAFTKLLRKVLSTKKIAKTLRGKKGLW